MMAAETNTTEQDSQIQEKTISSQTEELKKKSGDVDGSDVDEMPLKNGNHAENDGVDDIVQPSDGVVDDEKPPISESNEADCGIADELPISESNEADSGTTESVNNENNEADSGVEEERPSESIEADSGTMLDEAPSSGTMPDEAPSSEANEADSGSTKEDIPVQQDEAMATESVSSTAAVASQSSKTEEEAKTNGVKEKDEEKAEKKDNSLGSTVAKHYNDISPITRESRKESRIFHLRNFNNWIKSVVISEFLEKVKRRKRLSDDVNILDLACGKGGDILKWQKGKVDHVIMADIAAKSIEECKERYSKLQKDQRNNRYYRERLFTAEFFVADCTKKRLNDMYRRKGIKLDMSSCQFAFHYSFESYEQADLMLKNCCENLRVGGYFIGTTPDAQKLVKHIKACKADSFGNSVFNIKPEDKESFPLFGSKYMFYLEGVVDCPEFMVYLPLLEKMAAKYNMKLVWKKNFHDIFKEYERQHASLLAKMSALEQYPATTGQLSGGSESQYKSAKDFVDKKGNKRVGTLSADEWEVAGLYIAFAFEKVDPPEKKERGRETRIEDEKRDEKRDDRKRVRDDRGAKTDDRHHDRRKSSESSTTKRSRKDVEDEIYEIKDEVYEDEEKPEDKSKADRVSKSSSSSSSSRSSSKHDRSSRRSDEKPDSSKTRKSVSEKSSKDEDKSESQKADSTKEETSAEPEGESVAEEKSEETPKETAEEAPEVEAAEDVPVTSTDVEDTETAEVEDAPVTSTDAQNTETVEISETAEVSETVDTAEAIDDDDEEAESTTVSSTDVDETETATESVEPEEPMEE